MVSVSNKAVTPTTVMPTIVRCAAFSENWRAYAEMALTDSGSMLSTTKSRTCQISDSNPGHADATDNATVIMGTSATSVVKVRLLAVWMQRSSLKRELKMRSRSRSEASGVAMSACSHDALLYNTRGCASACPR